MKTILSMFLIACTCFAMTACSDDDGQDNNGEGLEDGSLVLKTDVEKITTSKYDAVTFSVMYNGKDVTKGAKIKDNGGNFVRNAVFSSEVAGKYEFRASYDGKLSAPVAVQVEKEKLFKKYLLMQQMTSIECVNCPAMTYNIDNVVNMYPSQIHVLAYHGNLNGVNPDPMGIRDYIKPIADKFNTFQSYPVAILDQTQVWSRNEGEAMTQLKDCLGKPGTVGIALTTKLNGRKLDINVRIKATESFQNKCRVAVLLQEDNLKYKQLTTDDGRNGYWNDNYIHNHVVRFYLTDVWGDLQELNAIDRSKEFSCDYSYSFPDNSTIPEDINKRKPENMNVLVYVTDGSDDRVINSQSVKVGESVDYVYEQ